MIHVSNKLESDAFIIQSGMNYTPFRIVTSWQEALCYVALGDINSREPFSIRFKGTGMQPFLPNLRAAEAYTYCREHFATSDTPLGIYMKPRSITTITGALTVKLE